jgi:sec-independent protein translocase protein TatA
MLGLDNPIHIAFILVLLLLVFGAKRLPEMGKSLGAGLRGFKDSISGDEPTAHLTEAHAPTTHVNEALAPTTVAENLTETVERTPVERTPAQPAA